MGYRMVLILGREVRRGERRSHLLGGTMVLIPLMNYCIFTQKGKDAGGKLGCVKVAFRLTRALEQPSRPGVDKV